MPIPDSDALKQAERIAFQSPEGAMYLVKAFEHVIDKHKLNTELATVLQELRDSAHLAALGFSESGSEQWFGKSNHSTHFETMQSNYAKEMSENLGMLLSEDDQIQLNAAVSDQSEFIRGFESARDGHLQPGEKLASLDNLLNAWFAEKGFIVGRDSQLYELGEAGAARKDPRGNDVRANPEDIKTLLKDQSNGFAKFMKDKGFQVNTTIYPYTKPQAAAAPESIQAERKAQAQPDAPHTTPSIGSRSE